MDAALRLLERDGVLAGLNLQEVADEAGVNRGLIHHYFGSRQALLRAALEARRRAAEPLVAELHRLDPWKRGDASFREYVRDPSYAVMVMLLALDGDEQFDPMPFLADRLADSEEERKNGVWEDDADLLALLVMFDVFHCGYFVLRSALARQLGVAEKTLDKRVRATLGRMYESFRSDRVGSVRQPSQ